MIKYLNLNELTPNKINPRLIFNADTLFELSESIKQSGILQPLIVRPKDDYYEIVIGERRYRAAQQAGLKEVPVIIRNYTDDAVIEINLIENTHREELSAVEKGNSVKMLMNEFPKKYPNIKAVAKQIGFSPSTIRSWLPLTKAPLEIQKMVAPVKVERRGRPEGSIDYTTANTILRKVKGPLKQIEVAQYIANNKRISQKTARKIIQEVVEKPDKAVADIVQGVLDEPYNMPFRLDHMGPILNDIKTQTSRRGLPDPSIKTGAKVYAAVWEPIFATLTIENVTRKRLGNFTEEDAKREGGYTLEEFKQVWETLHGTWNPQEKVYVIEFKRN